MPNGKSIALLKTLLTSACERDCHYCPFRAGRNFRRATLKPAEMAHIFMSMHRAGIVKGLFLSSGLFGGGVHTQDKLIDTVIKCNLEYMMIEGIYAIITNFRELFYSRVQTSKRAENYTMEIVASSAWTLLSRWHKTGKVESPSLLSKIYISAFRNVYFAIFKDRSLVGD